MRYLVYAPSACILQIEADNPDQAANKAGDELRRVLSQVADTSVEGSPDHCISFDWQIYEQWRVMPIGLPEMPRRKAGYKRGRIR